MKVGDLVRINKSRTTGATLRRLRRRHMIGKVGIIIEVSRVSKDYTVMTTIKVQWLDTQIVTQHNKFFVEVINATST